MKTILLFITFMFCSLSCTVDEPENGMINQSNALNESGALTDKGVIVPEEEFLQTIKSVYFQNWVSGVRGGGSGTNFFIEFEKKLPKEIVLKQVYFRDKEALINPIEETLYLSSFLNEFSNEGDVLVRENNAARFPIIKDNQAILEYSYYGRLGRHTLTDIEQLESEFYP